MVQLSGESEPAVLFMDSHAFEPGNVVGLETGMRTAYSSSVHSCDDESGVLVGEPVVPDRG